MAKKTSSQPPAAGPAAGKEPDQGPAAQTEPTAGQSDSGGQATDSGQPAADPVVPTGGDDQAPSEATVARVAAQFGERPSRQLAGLIKDVADRLGIHPDTVFAIGKQHPVVVTVDGQKLQVPHED